MSLKGVAKTSRLWGSHALARGVFGKRWNSTAVEGDVSEQLRRLMRNIPQPVAIATTLYQDKYHGATLSSFTSLTLHPYPLVAFSLRLPSRLADAIRPADPLLSKETELERMKEGLPPDPLRLDRQTSLNISLLDLRHESMAKELSRPGTDHSNVFSTSPFSTSESSAVESRVVGTNNELPVILDAIGNLKCQVVSSIPLKDVVSDSDGIEFDDEVEGAGLYKNPPQHIADNVAPAEREVEKSTGDQVHGSELFICRVVSVESGSGQDPMLYYKHQYTTVKDA